MDKYPKEVQEQLKVEWFGMDGALVLLYIVLSIIYGYGILNKINWIIGLMAPLVAAGITLFCFIKYMTEVFHFARENVVRNDEKN